jgi:hypothetical protein
MENCSLVLRIPKYGSDDAMEIAHIGSTIDIWSLAVTSKVDLLKLSYSTLPRRISKVGSLTPRYNTTERLPSFACESGTYHAFLLTCPEGAGKEDCWVDVTSTREELVGKLSRRIVPPRCPYPCSSYCRSFYGTTSDDLRHETKGRQIFRRSVRKVMSAWLRCCNISFDGYPKCNDRIKKKKEKMTWRCWLHLVGIGTVVYCTVL